MNVAKANIPDVVFRIAPVENGFRVHEGETDDFSRTIYTPKMWAFESLDAMLAFLRQRYTSEPPPLTTEQKLQLRIDELESQVERLTVLPAPEQEKRKR